MDTEEKKLQVRKNVSLHEDMKPHKHDEESFNRLYEEQEKQLETLRQQQHANQSSKIK